MTEVNRSYRRLLLDDCYIASTKKYAIFAIKHELSIRNGQPITLYYIHGPNIAKHKKDKENSCVVEWKPTH